MYGATSPDMPQQLPLSSGEVTRILAGGRHRRQLVVKDKRIVNWQHDKDDERGLGGYRHREESNEADRRRRVLVDVPHGGQPERQHLHGQRRDGERDERVRPRTQPPVDSDGGHVPARGGEQGHVDRDEREEQRGGVRRVRAVPSAVRGVRELAWVRQDGGRRGEHEDVRGEERQAGERHGDGGRRRQPRAADGRAQKQEHGGEHPGLGDAVRHEGVCEARHGVAARREHGGPPEEREAERLGNGKEPREEGEQQAGATERRAQVEDAAQAALPRARVEGDEHERRRDGERRDERGGGGGHEVGAASDGRRRDLPGHEGLLDRDAGLHCFPAAAWDRFRAPPAAVEHGGRARAILQLPRRRHAPAAHAARPRPSRLDTAEAGAAWAQPNQTHHHRIGARLG
ncbi:hypothetical protein SETIT_6G121600v2 [Setaria italica]|uniref:Uncharacterized protein n=1 Tax=Setaria italica TaxID=4555 RepID=A0A368RKN3_SETIT|nr:hypothetical protein SETIT_6G121600v2 [Setaria italica]